MRQTLAFALTILLTACQPAPTAYKPEPFSFESAATVPITMNVAKIELLNQYDPPLKHPNVEQDFLVTPSAAVEKWLDRRIRAAGSSGTLQIMIRDAQVIEKSLPKTEGIEGLFTDDQEARYDAKIVVTFRILDAPSQAVGDVEVTRFITMNERASVVERQQRFHRMLQAMMADFDREATARLQQYFLPYVR